MDGTTPTPTDKERRKARRLATVLNIDVDIMTTAIQHYPTRTRRTWEKIIYDGTRDGSTPTQAIESELYRLYPDPIGMTKEHRP